MFEVGLIRVLSTEDKEILNSHGRIIEQNFPNMKVESLAIKDQPKGIYDDNTEEIAKPKIIDLSKNNFSNKDVIIVSCAGDPALEELRNVMSIPIIGAGESAALLSKIYGNKVGIVGITRELPKSYVKYIGNDVIGEPFIPNINNTTDLMKSDGLDKVLAHCENLKNKGAEVLVFACTGLSTTRFAPIIEKEIGLPVVDCVYAEAVFANAVCLRNAFYNIKE